MKTDIKKKIRKSPLLITILENKEKIDSNPEILDMLAAAKSDPKSQGNSLSINDENSSNNHNQYD